MPWKESSVMNERMKFILRLEDGERMTDLCHEFQISRVTGHKIWKRYQEMGLDGLFDESRSPIRTPHKTEEFIINKILKLKSRFPSWGAQKLREYLIRKYPAEAFPSVTTFHNILISNNLVRKRRARTYKASGTNLSIATQPNDLWCTDFKGEFKLRNGSYCYPLTITDRASRFIINCTCLESTKTSGAMSAFKDSFEEFGLPISIRSDNGNPFATNSILGLSKLSVWWLRLGIEIERIRPGNPQENGQHERMHRDLKEEVSRRIKSNVMAQQEVTDDFRNIYNLERPHQGISNKVPNDLYVKSTRKFPKQLPEVSYEGAFAMRELSARGLLNYKNKEIGIGAVFSKQPVGLYRVEENIIMVKFMDLVLGHFDDRELKFSAIKEFVKL